MCVVIRTHLDTRFFPVEGFDRFVVHRHVMCVVRRTQLDTRFFPVGVDEGGGVRRYTEYRVDGYCLRTGVDYSGGVRRHTA